MGGEERRAAFPHLRLSRPMPSGQRSRSVSGERPLQDRSPQCLKRSGAGPNIYRDCPRRDLPRNFSGLAEVRTFRRLGRPTSPFFWGLVCPDREHQGSLPGSPLVAWKSRGFGTFATPLCGGRASRRCGGLPTAACRRRRRLNCSSAGQTKQRSRCWRK